MPKEWRELILPAVMIILTLAAVLLVFVTHQQAATREANATPTPTREATVTATVTPSNTIRIVVTVTPSSSDRPT